MQSNSALRTRRGEPIVKYYGKWPFLRILGFQEPASVFFSVVNLWPHIRYFKEYRNRVPKDYEFRNAWILALMLSINTWVCSVLFHTRDTWITERLDYFGAALGMMGNTSVSLLRIFGVKDRFGRNLILGSMLGAFLVHISYLQFVHFDYGLHMLVAMSIAVVFILSWLLYSVQLMRKPNGRYAWRAFAAMLILISAAGLELGDFPPIWGVFDAHSLWHAFTPAVWFLFYEFLIQDAQRGAERAKEL